MVGAVGAGKGGTVGDGGEEEGEGMGAEVGSMFELDPQAVDALVHEMVHVLVGGTAGQWMSGVVVICLVLPVRRCQG